MYGQMGKIEKKNKKTKKQKQKQNKKHTNKARSQATFFSSAACTRSSLDT